MREVIPEIENQAERAREVLADLNFLLSYVTTRQGR